MTYSQWVDDFEEDLYRVTDEANDVVTDDEDYDRARRICTHANELINKIFDWRNGRMSREGGKVQSQSNVVDTKEASAAKTKSKAI